MSLNDFLHAFPRWVSDLDWRFILLSLPPISLLFYILLTLFTPSSVSFSHFTPFFSSTPKIQPINIAPFKPPSVTVLNTNRTAAAEDGDRPERIAVCLVGGARRFELTGPSIVENILEAYPNADLFLHSPLDQNSFKFSILKISPRIASVRIFQPKPIPETEPEVRVLTADGSPNGIQGLLQYFNLVEGCLRLIEDFQTKENFKYDWIIRTRVDGYWNAPLSPEFFQKNKYIVPQGSSYAGLNDRFGIGDLRTSTIALSRLALVPKLDAAGLKGLNSEKSFKSQLIVNNISYSEIRLPFCIVSDRRYSYPPLHTGVPVAAMSSPGPLSGAKCRPCKAICKGECVKRVMEGMARWWSWTEWRNGTLELCDAHEEWENGWEAEFDRVAGEKLAGFRVKVKNLEIKGCVEDWEEVRRKAVGSWEAPPAEEICKLGMSSRQT